jgi:hypothetical protein
MNEVITILTSRLGNQIAKVFVELEFVLQSFFTANYLLSVKCK